MVWYMGVDYTIWPNRAPIDLGDLAQMRFWGGGI